MFSMLATRPDLSMAVNFYSQCDASKSQWKGLKRVLRYVKGTLDYTSFFRKGPVDRVSNSTVFADADWAGDVDRKSTSGYLIKLNDCLVSWCTKKQDTVALSSAEAEYVSLANS